MRSLNLPLKDNPYTIYIESGLISNGDRLAKYCDGDRILIVSNTIVAPLYLDKLKTALNDSLIANQNNKAIHQIVIEDGEIHKSKSSYFKILDYLIENEFRRNDTLIALGGGVIGDLSGFVAASYQRGMNFLQLPTSLLAQVDSSVGGKTAINHPLGKNLIGAFYQPVAVMIDTETLTTLPDREYFSGLGEIIKYALLGEQQIANLLQNNYKELTVRDPRILNEIIYLSCQMKASIVAKDEKEKGERALLNLGHTFAHALETLTDYKYYLHGEAVAVGILMALRLSEKKGLINEQLLIQYQKLITSLNLPTKVLPKLKLSDFLTVMKKDKKNQTAAYRLVLVQSENKGSFCIIREENEINEISSTLIEFGIQN